MAKGKTTKKKKGKRVKSPTYPCDEMHIVGGNQHGVGTIKALFEACGYKVVIHPNEK